MSFGIKEVMKYLGTKLLALYGSKQLLDGSILYVNPSFICSLCLERNKEIKVVDRDGCFIFRERQFGTMKLLVKMRICGDCKNRLGTYPH